MRWPLVILALSGCDQVFGLDRGQVAIDASADADGPIHPFDAPPDAACIARVARGAVADGQLNTLIPTQPGNDVGAMNLQYTTGLHTVGVFKFDVAGEAPPDAIELIVPHATHDVSCGGTCASTCTALEQAGSFRVYAMSSNWDEHGAAGERGATWSCRRGTTSSCPGQTWFAAGATDGQDRDATSVPFTSAVGADAHVMIDPAMWTWVQAKELSFQVVPDFNSGKMMVRAHENCETGTAAAQLVLYDCP